MVVAREEMYDKLKGYNWNFRGAEYDLYSSVEIDEDDALSFQLNNITFTLDTFVIRGATAKINASCKQNGEDIQFAFIGTAI